MDLKRLRDKKFAGRKGFFHFAAQWVRAFSGFGGFWGFGIRVQVLGFWVSVGRRRGYMGLGLRV